MTKSVTDWCCAGCERLAHPSTSFHYPPIKIPSGEVDKSQYPILGVMYHRYCLACATAMLSDDWEPKKRWWKPWWWFRKELPPWYVSWREANKLRRITGEWLETIYE